MFVAIRCVFVGGLIAGVGGRLLLFSGWLLCGAGRFLCGCVRGGVGFVMLVWLGVGCFLWFIIVVLWRGIKVTVSA